MRHDCSMTNRVQRIAKYVAWMATAMMITLGGMIWLLTSDWFLVTVAKANPGANYVPVAMVTAAPQLVLVLGFFVILAALCGGFRRLPL